MPIERKTPALSSTKSRTRGENIFNESYVGLCEIFGGMAYLIGAYKIAGIFDRQGFRTLALDAYHWARQECEDNNNGEMHEIAAKNLQYCLDRTGWQKEDYSVKLGVEESLLCSVLAPVANRNVESQQKREI